MYKNIYTCMIRRIEIYPKVFDTRSEVRLKFLHDNGWKRNVRKLIMVDVYTIEKNFSSSKINSICSILSNPVTQQAKTGYYSPSAFNWCIEIGYLPGVTDNIAHTAKESIEDHLKNKFTDSENVYTSQMFLLFGDLTRRQVTQIAESFYNPLIMYARIKSYAEFTKDKGMDCFVPRVQITQKPSVKKINLNISDDQLSKIGKYGISNDNGGTNGPLALDLSFMKTIQAYFKKRRRDPTDIELESIAQTWSEHCKHTIFADPLDELKKGLFTTYIKKATEVVRKKSGKKDLCASVFTDNSGAIVFDKQYLITHKVETHNSPSALDPFGGAITGIVGVNRDTIGFGLGAKPIANFYGYCFADPTKDIPLYKGVEKTQKMLSSRRIMDGVIAGVNAGGNQSGIPTPSGFVYFDQRYQGKPLVFVGTIGLIPKKIKNKNACFKKARPGDFIVMIGGRVGKDGIHGATFSSEAMDSGSPVTAVQIGDPITQKKLSDALTKEARDMLLYNSITDNGAGGLSCSVAEMAKESGGCQVELEKVPLKYPGLTPWEIWISESQERMTLAIPQKNWIMFADLMVRRGVEATVIGKFTDSGRCIVNFSGEKIMDIDMKFLHYGLPQRKMGTKRDPQQIPEKYPDPPKRSSEDVLLMLKRLNIASFEFITRQYDHIVQGNLALGPLAGAGRVNTDTTAIRPVLGSRKGVILSNALFPSYSELDPYAMAASAIDTAIRNIISAGGQLGHIALLDNFCWCSGFDPVRLDQLKKAAKACFDYATRFNTPFISGKDSMFNDFKGFDEKGNPIQISIPPTLLISSIGIIDDVHKLISLDVKHAVDLIYLLGETYDEMGGSEYLKMKSEKDQKKYTSIHVPRVDAMKNIRLYKAFAQDSDSQIISSAISIGRGGLLVALSKMAMAGMLGIDVTLQDLPGSVKRDDIALFSESQGRIITTIAVENRNQFEKVMKGIPYACIGKVTKDQKIIIRGLKGHEIVNITVGEALKVYRETFKNY
jgi:phosphoribosylformylglycinamidine synthase subunit PurSL